MRNLFNRQFEMLVRVGAFGRKYAGLFPDGGLAGHAFAIINAVLPDLSTCAGSQAAGFARSREAAQAKANVRQRLVDLMEKISLTARAIARVDKAVRSKFVVPKSASDRDLIGVARGFATNAEVMKSQFIAHEMNAAFIDDLNAAIADFEVAIVNHNDAKGDRTNATASVEATIEKAVDAAYRLDGIVPNKLAGNYALLKEWETARKVARARKPKPVDNGEPPAVMGNTLPPLSAADPPAAAAQG